MADRPRVAGGLLPAGAANRLLLLLVGRLGLPVAGAWVLRTRGRRSGRVYDTPVIPVRSGDAEYLVAPRGRTDWMANLLAGGGELRRGRRTRRVTARRVPVEDRVAPLTAYLRANRRRNGRFFDVPDAASPEDIARIAGHHPVARLD